MSSEAASEKLWLSHQPRGAAWYRALADAQGHDTFLVSFSRGKDSLSATIALRDAGFGLVPFTMVGVPGLSFIEESLDYYERNLFDGQHITRALSPNFLHLINRGMYGLPQWLPVADVLRRTVDFEPTAIQESLIEKHGFPAETMTAMGVRAFDNLWRRKILVINGPVIRKKRQFYANWDWKMDRVVETIAKSGLKLPPDYHMWGHSYFDGQPEFLLPIRERYPADYRKILEWFPLMEATMYRFDMMRR